MVRSLIGQFFLGMMMALAGRAHAEEAAPPDKALLIVRLPASARLTVQAAPTHQTGSERSFISPSLPQGEPLTYTLVATWNLDGQEHQVTREVPVRAGTRVEVDLQAPASATPQAPPNSRTFLFTYQASITGLPPGKRARIWLPVPPSNDDQEVQLVSKKLPTDGQISRDARFGNQILYVEAAAGAQGEIPLELTYRVTRREVKAARKPTHEETKQLALFLAPDAKVPIDGKPLELLKDKRIPKEPLAAARTLYDLVDAHMRYSKEGIGWGRGDAVWACESGYGNCSDFHSLFISLSRALKIPAKFEIGFPLPPQHGAGTIPGYHCWAKFHPPDDGWVPVDISEANKNPQLKDYYFGNLTADRVLFSTGRDLELVPRQDGPPLNYFIYPYVEVDGKPYAGDKIVNKFSYEDQPIRPAK